MKRKKGVGWWPLMVAICLICSGSFVLVDTFALAHVSEVTYVVPTESSTPSSASNQAITNTAANTNYNENEVLSTTVSTVTTNAEDTLSVTSIAPNKSSDDEAVVTAEGAVAQTSPQIVMGDGHYSYSDDQMQIQIDKVSENGIVYYVADVQLSSADLLKTALANDTFGTNITDTTSNIASDHDAIFAINGDYYGFRDDGVVMRNGQLLRTTLSDATSGDALLIKDTGELLIESENAIDFDALDENGIVQILSFGPALVEEGSVVNHKTNNSNRENPRTAIGQVSDTHYIFIVVDGRTQESQGITTTELAQLFVDRGCITAYNLDGGGSSTMYFYGEVINNPTDGKKAGERKVSDIVYIGY